MNPFNMFYIVSRLLLIYFLFFIFLAFECLKKSLFCFQFWNIFSLGIKLMWPLFLLNTLKMLLHNLFSCHAFNEKSALLLICVPVFIICLFFFPACHYALLSYWSWANWLGCICDFLYFPSISNIFYLLVSVGLSFHQICKILPIFLQMPISFSLGDSNYLCIWLLKVFPEFIKLFFCNLLFLICHDSYPVYAL